MTTQIAIPGLRAVPPPPTTAPTGASDEWYTPREVLELLPPIDLDPCSPPHRPVQAREHYVLSEGRDGLAEPWHGVVFCNPPYSAGELPRWTRKCRDEVAAGRAKCVIGLVPARPGSAYWGDNVWRHAVVGFWPGRIAFDTIAGPGQAGGTFDSALVVWGDAPRRFLLRTFTSGVTWVQRKTF